MAAPDRHRRPRLAGGELTSLVRRHLQAHPDLDFSPYEVATVLGCSHGTIRRILLRLADSDTVTRTQHEPTRFCITS